MVGPISQVKVVILMVSTHALRASHITIGSDLYWAMLMTS